MPDVFKALADPTRREILRLLRARERSAGDIATHFNLAKPTLSGHLAILREAGLIEGERQGTTILYRLRLSVLEDALLAFADAFGIGAGRKAAAEPECPSP